MNGKMIGATLPGNSTVEFKEFDIPKPGHGQVLIQTMASTICGSDILSADAAFATIAAVAMQSPAPRSTGRPMAGSAMAGWRRIS